MEMAPTEEVVAAFLDYLVDPMLPLRASGKDPPLETQEAVAKQMHAVVLLYNYYHRDQNPQLEFIEFGAFCKLAVSLKPALTAHMKYMQQADSSGSNDMENQFSVTEKAIKDACKISLSLTSLKDVSNAEGWPVSKVSVLLVDSKKENCLLLFGPITNGVWSVIEKCLDISVLPRKGPSKGKYTNKRKHKGGKVPTGEQSDGEFAFQQIALSAVEEATGISQSEVTVLEKHVTYSLSEENMAAYFYIMQCTQSSNEDIQIPIKDVSKSLQGPLLKRTPNDWILTPKIEYYNVLPYARIMLGWLSREGVSACSQTLILSSSCEAEKDSEMEAADIEKVNSNGLHSHIVELENVNSISSQGPEKPSDWEAQGNMGSINGNCSSADSCGEKPTGADSSNRKEEADDKESTGADISNRKEEVDEKEPTGADISNRKEEVDDKNPTGADISNKKEEVDDKEKPYKKSAENPSDGEPTGADSSNKEEEVDDKEKLDTCTPINPSDREVQYDRGSIYGNCTGGKSCGKEQTGVETSNRKEFHEKPDKYSPEKPSDGEPTGADSCKRKKEEVDDKEKTDNSTPEKPNDWEVQDNRYGVCTGVNSCDKVPTREESSNNREEVDDKEILDKYSLEIRSDGEPNGAASSNGKEEVDDKGKPDNSTPEKPNEREVQGNSYGDITGAYSCGKEPTGEETSNEEEVHDKEIPDKHSSEMQSDGEPTGAERYNRKRKEVDESKKPNKCTPEKPIDGDILDNRGSTYGNCTGANSCSKEPIRADSFNRKEVDDKEKPDKGCDITNSSTLSFSNADVRALKMTSAEELQISSNFSSKRQKTDVDGIAIRYPARVGKRRNASMPIRVYHHKKRKISVENASCSLLAGIRFNMEASETIESNSNEFIDGKVAGICTQGSISSLNEIPAGDCALVPYEPNANNVEKLQTVLATKETEISETALRVLLQKREEMCHQQRILEDKIALCSRDIQKIIDGDKDALALKLEAMIDCCNDTWLKGKTQIEGEIHQSDVQRTGQCSRRNRLSDAFLSFQSPCQELDDICHANNWRLPSYSVSASTGGFVAYVTMKEMNFDFSCEGALLSNPQAARDSAAALMVAKLREV